MLQNEDARNMSGIETISAGWIISNSWAGIAATFALAIAQGGPVTLIYGPIIMCVLVGACAISLAELASVYPTVSCIRCWYPDYTDKFRLVASITGSRFWLLTDGVVDWCVDLYATSQVIWNTDNH